MMTVVLVNCLQDLLCPGHFRITLAGHILRLLLWVPNSSVDNRYVNKSFSATVQNSILNWIFTPKFCAWFHEIRSSYSYTQHTMHMVCFGGLLAGPWKRTKGNTLMHPVECVWEVKLQNYIKTMFVRYDL